MKFKIVNYTTEVDAERTVAEIQKLLVSAGANAIAINYEEGLPTGLAFRMMTPGGERSFSLPCRWRQVQVVLRDHMRLRPSQYRDEQALRVSWRILKVWVEAQIAMVQTNLVSIDEAFTAYMQIGEKQTVYDALKANVFPRLTG